MVGVLICNERNRAQLTQDELGGQVGIWQVDLSNIENGYVPERVTDNAIRALFRRLHLDSKGEHAAFLIWWRDHYF
jgi:transcriptional regulator with XRE-family HTH domain